MSSTDKVRRGGGASSSKSANIAAAKAKAKKKIDCEKKAYRIVESLLDNPISEEYLIDSAAFLTPTHYADVAVERSVGHLCGYPLCLNELRDMPKQKYHISTKVNNVYDISERKCFCSNHCYKSSKYYQEQISTSPLWMRDEEKPPAVHLLKKTTDGGQSQANKGYGEAMLVAVKVRPEDIENAEDDDLTLQKVASDLRSSMMLENDRDDGSHESVEKDSAQLSTKTNSTDPNDNGMADIKDSCSENKNSNTNISQSTGLLKDLNEMTLEKEAEVKVSKAMVECTDTTDSSLSTPGTEKADVIRDKFKKEKGKKVKKSRTVQQKVSPLETVTERLRDWRTAETLRIVFGDEVAKEYEMKHEVKEQAAMQVPQSVQSAAMIQNQPLDLAGQVGDTQEVTQDARKHSREEESSRIDGTTDRERSEGPEMKEFNPLYLESSSMQAPTKPLPDLKEIEKDRELFELKLKDYFPRTFGKVAETKSKKGTKEEEEDDRQIILPPVDSQAQSGIRRKIVVDKLSQVYASILGSLRLTRRDIAHSLGLLVKSFHLHSKNVTLRPAEWTLMAVVLLYALSRNDSHLGNTLTSSNSVTCMSSLLAKLGTTTGDIQKIVDELQS
ncbi:putative RNA polymerase II subunit B1 CTD phosphatase rpap2 [Glandiceps talaboti]